MTFLNKFDQISFPKIDHIFLQGVSQVCESIYYDRSEHPQKRKIKLHIVFTKNQYIVYIQDGQIIRIEQLLDNSIQPTILAYLDQIKYLNWIGDYGKNLQKIGRWFAKWNMELMIDVGGQYSTEGKKIGFWKELIENYQENAQVLEFGEYLDDQKKGLWQFLQNEELIGGGLYNQQGFKHGLWTDLSENYCKTSQVIYVGEYKNGKKVGYWKSKFKDQIIGGGFYNKYGLKRGKWIELIEGFSIISQITFVGEYRNGQKFGIWSTLEENQYIGCGVYDTQGLKNKKWFDLSENFQDYIQIMYQGEYNNGKRQGQWETLFRYDRQSNFESMCQGFYDNNGLKNGKWIELNNNFNHTCQVIYEGEYKNGIFINRWNAMYRYDEDHGFLYFGGGSFDHNGLKYGKWVELWNQFGDESQVTFNGEYNNHKKTGQWDIMFRYSFWDQFKKVGGGLYNEDGIKYGIWIELSKNFQLDQQIVYQGEYQNGIKCGLWVEMIRDRDKKDEGFRIVENNTQQFKFKKKY